MFVHEKNITGGIFWTGRCCFFTMVDAFFPLGRRPITGSPVAQATLVAPMDDPAPSHYDGSPSQTGRGVCRDIVVAFDLETVAEAGEAVNTQVIAQDEAFRLEQRAVAIAAIYFASCGVGAILYAVMGG
jgi:hypothetical protein